MFPAFLVPNLFALGISVSNYLLFGLYTSFFGREMNDQPVACVLLL